MSLVAALLFLTLARVAAGMTCNEIPGHLSQIDAGNGQVFGVNENGNIFTLYGSKWTPVPGTLVHVTVGGVGVWGVNKNNNIYKMVGGSWVKIIGTLKQIDAGGALFVAGVQATDDIYCLGSKASLAVKDGTSVPWNRLDGKLKYMSCGPKSCWGVNSAGEVHIRYGVTQSWCVGDRWQKLDGNKLSMIEVGSDGSVYGVNSAGNLYRRLGINDGNLAGTSWTQLGYNSKKFKHVSEDLGLLWLITIDKKILKCKL